MAGWLRKGRTWAISRHGGSFHSPLGDRRIYPALALRRYIRRRLFRMDAYCHRLARIFLNPLYGQQNLCPTELPQVMKADPEGLVLAAIEPYMSVAHQRPIAFPKTGSTPE
jgi:hypothetical protein